MATYGIEVLTGLSKTRLDSNKRTLRSVRWEKLLNGTSGTLSVPEFSDTKGYITFIPVNNVFLYSSFFSWDESNKVFDYDLDQTYEVSDVIVSFMMYG